MTTPTPAQIEAAENTDRELWREREGDYYANSIHVTKDGSIGMNCGGNVVVMPIRKWFALTAAAEVGEQYNPEMVKKILELDKIPPEASFRSGDEMMEYLDKPAAQVDNVEWARENLRQVRQQACGYDPLTIERCAQVAEGVTINHPIPRQFAEACRTEIAAAIRKLGNSPDVDTGKR